MKRTSPAEAGATGAAAAAGRSLRGPTLGDRVYEEILHLIVDSNIPEGGRLPTEARFCALFSVSRTVVREALTRLKIDGVVASRQGQGSIVLRRPNAGVFAFPEVGGIADMQRFFEFRQIVEGEIAALAALRRSHDDVARIRAALAAIAAALGRDGMGVEEDLAFHLAIAEAARNKFLLAALISARGNFVQGIRFARVLSMKPDEARGQRLLGEHARIVEAIEAGDAAAARAAMIAHLNQTRDRVFLGA